MVRSCRPSRSPTSKASLARVLLVVLAALAFASCSPSAPQPPTKPPPPPVGEGATVLPSPREDGRLPALAVPLHYALSFDVDPGAASFAGSTRIDVEIPQRTSHVVLDAHALRVADAYALIGQERRRATTSVRAAFGAKGALPEELVLTFEPPLPAGRASLVVDYAAPFDEELSGLYRVQDDGRWYAFTQFEATDARRAFPCFDEPSFKVPFDVRVTVPKGMLAVANTPEATREDVGPNTTFHFAETLPLPTYLVALAIGDLEIKELPRTTKPPVRIITTKGKTAMGALALEATSGLIDALATWFGVPYPYEKLDVVAVPDFAAGAMENAGLVTFREELLLLDPARASVRARRSQALVVAHELAHQWFGNLVTAAWWDDLWLNEGFATWMEARIVDIWRPSFGARLDAVAFQLGVMDLDALASARAVRQPVVSTSDADEAFDGITYQKGGAVLGTIERWIGEDTFQKGVREYIAENAFKSVHADRLFATLDRASGKNVTQMASTFLDHPGVPEVSGKIECDRGARWHVELAQEAWRPLGSKVPESSDRAWTVPVCTLAQGEKKSQCAELAFGAPSLVAGRGCPAWLHPNSENAYYRFTLPEGELMKLASARKDLDVTQRISLLSNAWAAVRAGKLKPGVMLKLLPLFDDDPSRQVVEQVVGILGGMSMMLVEEDARPAFRKFALARLAKRKKDLGWLPKKDEATGSGDESILRRAVLGAMGDIAEDDATLREADEHAARWLADHASVDADSAGVALDLSTRHAGAARLTALVAAAHDAKTREDRILALRALPGFDDPALLKSAMDVMLTDEIRVQDMRYLLVSAFYRRSARMTAEAWIEAHWDDLRKKLPGSLGTGLVGAAAIACTKSELAERAAFYTPRAAAMEGGARPLAENLEAASLCAELRTSGAASLTRELLNATGPKKAP